MLKLALVGCGAIGRALIPSLATCPEVQLSSVLVRDAAQPAASAWLKGLGLANVVVASSLEQVPHPDLLLECAGHTAIEQHVLPALSRGIAAVVVSIGALSEPQLALRLEQAARHGKTRVTLVAGTVGAIDALAAARLGELSQVCYTGRKPPHAWLGTPAGAQCDLQHLQQAVEIFSGSAREAAATYPRNANVAATVALAGLGLDDTQVRLLADPAVTSNVHEISASGAFGRFEFTLHGQPLPDNPKTSALTVYSALRAVLAHAAPVIL